MIEALKENSEKGIDFSKDYAETTLEYSKLKIFQILTYSLSTLSKLLLIGSFLFLGLLFITIAGAIALGKYFDNIVLGYLSIGFLLTLFALIIYLLRKSFIDKKIISKMSNYFFNSEK